MSKGNPKKAVAALLPPPIRCTGGVTVRPMTLAMFAALERIESPMVTGKDAKDMVELIPSIYLLTHGPEAIFDGNLLDLAMRWADTVPVDTMAAVRKACERQMQTVVDVIPEASGKKRSDDGWIAFLLDYVASRYHWAFREIFYEIPLATIALLRRQGHLDKIFPLSKIEEIDNGGAKA